MISVTGPTKPALMLLCCVSAWTSIHTFPTDRPSNGPTVCEVQLILKNLDNLSTQLLQDYRKNESDMPDSQAWVIQKYPLPCFTPGPQASHNISVIQAYLRKTTADRTDRVDRMDGMVADVLEQLDKLKDDSTPEALATTPASSGDAYEGKSFILAVLHQFSGCMAETREAFTKSLPKEGQRCSLMK
ncbi:interleukin-31 [Marmota flaviventris]|uniref:interleukin-31 n=1 Tax=Marmota flaviventris TaxID=93162 RepID=UPI000FFF6CE3|nr:interleukin-31 [Marmota flaviventris]